MEPTAVSVRLGARIRARREARGWSQANLAEAVELTPNYIGLLERGEALPTLQTLLELGKALDASPTDLLGGSIDDPWLDRIVAVASAVPPDQRALALALMQAVVSTNRRAPPQAKSALKQRAPEAAPGDVLGRLRAAGYQVRDAGAPGRRPAHAVRVMTIRAAAGVLKGSARSVETLGWVMLSRKGPPPEGQFVAVIEGDSMEPRVPSGAVCLFGPPRRSLHGDGIFLVGHSSLDEDGPYALKQLESRKRKDGRMRMTLRSINPAYSPIVVDADDGEVRVIAELVDILVPNPSTK